MLPSAGRLLYHLSLQRFTSMFSYRLLRSLLPALLLAVAAAHAQPGTAPRIFEDRSGVVKLKISMRKMQPLLTLYFDDYGRKTLIVLDMNVPREHMVQHILVIGDTTIKWEEQKMRGTKTVGPNDLQRSLIEYMNMDDARKQALNYREIEPREILGRSAPGFSIDTTIEGSVVTHKIWHWHGIPFYWSSYNAGQLIQPIIEATNVDVSSALPAGIFEVPPTVRFENSESSAPTQPQKQNRRNSRAR